jgi:hypothetical protein
MAFPFASLTPTQQAQAARIFQDGIFGSDPAAYTYELEATGHLTGQRCKVAASEAKKLHGKRSPLCMSTSGPLVLSAQNAQVFARLILPGLLKFQDAPWDFGNGMTMHKKYDAGRHRQKE